MSGEITQIVSLIVERKDAFYWRWAVTEWESTTGLTVDLESGSCFTMKRAQKRGLQAWERICE